MQYNVMNMIRIIWISEIMVSSGSLLISLRSSLPLLNAVRIPAGTLTGFSFLHLALSHYRIIASSLHRIDSFPATLSGSLRKR